MVETSGRDVRLSIGGIRGVTTNGRLGLRRRRASDCRDNFRDLGNGGGVAREKALFESFWG